MMRVGYHCSHEQFGPRDLLARVVEAQQAGFIDAFDAQGLPQLR